MNSLLYLGFATLLTVALSMTSCRSPQESSVSNHRISVQPQESNIEKSMSDQVFYTLEWTAGIEIFDTSYNRVAESSQQVTFTLPKFSQNSFHIDDAQEAAVIEMNLNKHLSLCYLILKSTDGGQQQPEYLDLYGWVFNNWIVAGSSSPELVRKSIPENTIYLEENPKKEIIDKSFVTWGGEEYEYTLFSQLKVLNESSEAPTNANLLSPKPIEEAKQCIAASPQVILRSLQDL